MQIHLWQVLLIVVVTIVIYCAFNIHHTHKYSRRDKNYWRGYLTINDPEYRHRGVDLRLQVSYGWKKTLSGVGFKIHFGNRGSETPFHLNLYLYWVSFFFSMSTPNMGRFFEWLGRGHKRDISIQTHSGQIWWKLWYDDDNGYDNYHNESKCKHHRPWWWPFGSKEAYRSWVCLRDGNQELNPLSAIWGVRYYHNQALESREDVFGVYQFPGDFYDVTFTLQRVTRGRRRGPKWVRHVTDEGYSVKWECREGIPFRPDQWKGDSVYSSAVKVSDRENWLGQAHNALQESIIEYRKKNGFRPPATPTPEESVELDQGLVIDYVKKED